MKDRPWFIWDIPITEPELRTRLRHEDPRVRAQWAGRILREARYEEVWEYLSVEEILQDWKYLERHLGRRRQFWTWLLRGWREDGLIPA